MDLALYDPRCGYYAQPQSRVGKEGDFVTGPVLSPAFAYAIGRLVREWSSRAGDGMCTIVDIGCGDGSLIQALASIDLPNARFVGVDRSLERVRRDPRGRAVFVRTLDEVPREGVHLILSNELFDALPFARLVRRGGGLHELYVTLRDGTLDWSEREAPPAYREYFESRGIELHEGQFADVSLEWEALYGEIAAFAATSLVVTFDYGYPQKDLFHPRARRYGTAAAYSRHRVSRDLLARPGEQDLTAHINFTDLVRAGEGRGLRTLFFERQAKFLLLLGITSHEDFRPADEVPSRSLDEAVGWIDRREEARRLVLPDGIGHDIRVLVQSRGLPDKGWSFQNELF
ncbi:MAG TPA: SAM-dependent methyltransferase [Thermoanaerobaculia bacterium]|nr:SAM-dependent methyltransferase [Thermoanaerobaculia bacterium]